MNGPPVSKLFQYRQIIVSAAFGIGIASVMGFLPALDFLGDNQQYAYAGVIALGAWVWFKEYHERAMRANQKLAQGYTKTPDYDVRGQAPVMSPLDAGAAPQAMIIQPLRPSQSNMLPTRQPPATTDKLFEDFEKS